jgi:hypothetical protein
MKTETLDISPGERIDTACEKAIRMAGQTGRDVEFQFNDIKVTASPGSIVSDLVAEFHAEGERLHREYIASPEYKLRKEESERKERERESQLSAMLVDAPEHLSLRDPAGWKKACDANSDGYGGAVMTFAERWARLMEARMAKGDHLEGMAEECSHLADNEGITGFMYGCAVSVLSQVWQHGEALRVWHNLGTQLRNEGELANASGGVLNPALLSID